MQFVECLLEKGANERQFVKVPSLTISISIAVATITYLPHHRHYNTHTQPQNDRTVSFRDTIAIDCVHIPMRVFFLCEHNPTPHVSLAEKLRIKIANLFENKSM